MSNYTCLRCGGSDCRPSAESEADDDIEDAGDDDRLMGWCDDCGDVRPLEAD